MKVSVSLDDKEIKEMIKRFPRKIEKASKTAILQTAFFVNQKIVNRTKSGRSSAGGSFVPYAKRTIKSRTEKTRQTGIVDLIDTGNMMAAIKVRSKNPFVSQVYIPDIEEARKAMWHHKGRGNLPKREWFDIATNEEPLVIKTFRNSFIKQLNIAKA
jgi:hypothetical protein